MFDQVPLDTLFSVPQRNGLTKPKRLRGEGVKMVNMGELFAERRIQELPMDRVPCSERELETNRLEKGDLLFARQSLTLEGAGQSSIFLGDQEDVVFESHLIRCRLDKSRVDPLYYFYFFESKFGKQRIGSIVEQVAAAGIRGSDLIKLPVFLPSLSDQKAIAHILGTLDDKIELNQRMNQTLEDISKTIFKSWFVDFDPVRAKAEGRPTGLPPEISDLFPDELVDSEIGEIPKGWSPSVAGDLFDCLDRKRVPLSGNDRAKRQGSIPYYGATGVIDHVDDHIFDGTYLLIGEDGSVEKEDGTAFSQYVSGKIWVNNHAHVLIGKGSISTEFLYLAFQFVKVSPFVTGAVQLKISQTNLRSIPITSPSPEISEQFQGIVAPMFERRLLLEKENLCLAELRDTLLPKLISGELRIPDAEKLLEEAGI